MPRWRAATSCRRCTACRSASRTCRKPPACAPPSAARSSATMSRPPTNGWSRRCARPAPSSSARPTRRSSAPGRIRATRSTARPAIRSTRLDHAPVRPADRRWRWRPAWCRSAPAPTPAGSLRNPAAFCGIVGFRPTPGLVANERRGLGWNNLSVAGPDGAHRAGPVPAALRHGQRRCARSAGDHGAWPHDPPPRGFRHTGAHRPVAPARRVHAGFRLRAHRASHRRGVRARRPACSATCSRRTADATPGLRRCRRGVRGAARIGLPRQSRREGAHPPAGCRPERPRQCRGRPALHRRRRRARADAANHAVSPLAGVLPELGRDPDALDHASARGRGASSIRRRSTASRPAPTSTGWRWPMR